MLNLIEMVYALMVSDDINIWHFPTKKENPRFYYWLNSEPDNKEGYGFNTFEELIAAAYAKIDPQLKPLPPLMKPTQATWFEIPS